MSFKPLRAMVGMIAALVSLFVIYGTFGTALMVFKNSAEAITPLLKLSSNWALIANTSTTNFDVWFSSIWVVGVAIIVYTVLSLVSSTDQDRAPMG